MERSPKRQRLLDPDVGIAHEQRTPFEKYYDTVDYDQAGSEEEDLYGVTDDEDEEEDEEDVEAGEGNPDDDLEKSRAALDSKLKSQFEAIFEKYGRDFTGIGDEIDLRTGEIVVNNGHLAEMLDETDAGQVERGRSMLRAFTEEPEDVPDTGEEDTEDAEEEDEEMEDVEEAEEEEEDEDDDEEDMLLYARPVAKPSTPSKRPPGSFFEYPEPPSVQRPLGSFFDKPPTPQRPILTRSPDIDQLIPKPGGTLYPTDAEIIAEFGEKLGPQVIKYISQGHATNENSIEPAWRTPGEPVATPGKRPILKSLLLRPEGSNSPEPKSALGLWAPDVRRLPGRPRKDGSDVMALLKGEKIVNRKYYKRKVVTTTQSTEYSTFEETFKVPLNDAEGDTSESQNKEAEEKKVSNRRRTKAKFTEEDDEMLLDWVRRIRRRPDIPLFSQGGHWHDLEAINPRHSALSYLNRYRQYYYLVGKHHLTAPEGADPEEYVPRKRKRKSTATPDAESGHENADIPTVPELKVRFYKPPDNSSSTNSQTPLQAERSQSEQHDLPDSSSVVLPPVQYPAPAGESDSQSLLTQTMRPSEELHPLLHQGPPGVPQYTSIYPPIPPPQQPLPIDTAVPIVAEDPAPQNDQVNHDGNSAASEKLPVPTAETVVIASSDSRVPKDASGAVETGEHTQSAEPLPNPKPTTSEALAPTPQLSAKQVKANEGGQRLIEQFKRTTVPSSYDFSDEEDEAPPKKPAYNSPRRAPVADMGSGNIETAVEKTAHLQEPESLHQTEPQRKPSDAASANKPPLSTPPDQQEALPVHNRSSTKLKRINRPLLEILDSDDTDELSLTPESTTALSSLPLMQSRSKITLARSESRASRPIDRFGANVPGANSTPRNRNRSILDHEGGPSSPSPAFNKTPGGTIRRCGEAGFRCERDFCFKCQS